MSRGWSRIGANTSTAPQAETPANSSQPDCHASNPATGARRGTTMPEMMMPSPGPDIRMPAARPRWDGRTHWDARLMTGTTTPPLPTPVSA
jgi:hypothetical protein